MTSPLRIGILSFLPKDKKEGANIIRLRNTALAMGHKARIFRNAHFQFMFGTEGKPTLLYKNKKMPAVDVMIIKANVLENVEVEVSTVKHLQLMKIPVVNHYLPIVRAKNKVRTLQILQHEGIPIPKTVVIHHVDYVDKAAILIGSFPIVIKTPNGSQGMGVTIVESRRSLHSMLDLISDRFLNNLIIVQEYVREAKGKDIRVFIIGDKIIAAMERRAKRGEFRSNVHRGGSVSTVQLSDEEKKVALQATKVIGLDMAGVDIIRTAQGPKVIEVNSNPGIDGITSATGINVAEHIIKYAVKAVKQEKWLLQKESVVRAA